MDLTKGPPRSPRSKAVFNCVAVARMADKGRAYLAGKTGEYLFGSKYGMDRGTLEFLGLTTEEFVEGLKACPDDKTLTALSTTLALFQIQLNALMLLVDRHVAAGTVREDFQRLVSEGVSTVGLETMKEIKNRIREGIVQQDLDELRRDG